jgi:hypothetical protein
LGNNLKETEEDRLGGIRPWGRAVKALISDFLSFACERR